MISASPLAPARAARKPSAEFRSLAIISTVITSSTIFAREQKPSGQHIGHREAPKHNLTSTSVLAVRGHQRRRRHTAAASPYACDWILVGLLHGLLVDG
jgi:hypothetical protein